MTDTRTANPTQGNTGQANIPEQEVDKSKAHEFKDVDGNVVDAPVISSYEQELTSARDSADEGAIAEVTERYYEARKKRQDELNKRERNRRKDDK